MLQMEDTIKANQQMTINHANKNIQVSRESLDLHLKSITNFWIKIQAHQLSCLPLEWCSYAFYVYNNMLEHGWMAEMAPKKFARVQQLVFDAHHLLNLQEESNSLNKIIAAVQDANHWSSHPIQP